ncbi:TerB family tellurite resistance protein [Methylocystis sp.]|uniref:TerB family tellurite resistance protein n=1 Tax=Methylocystis sp. TaxID=1911079 RepID=UPI003DA30BE9
MNIPGKDHLTYLANIIAIARADQKIQKVEDTAIDEIRVQIGAKKSDVNAAYKLVEREYHRAVPVDGFAFQVMNLSDMLYVAMIDGDWNPAEEEIIRGFQKQIGVTDEQLDKLMLEAVQRSQAAQATISCPNCKTALNAGARFCSACGAAVAAVGSGATQMDMEIPPEGYVIEFCESTAAGFPAALEFAKASKGFQSCIRSKKTWYQASWPESEFTEVLKLANFLTGMRNRRCYQVGQARSWEEMFGCAWCVRERESAYRPIEYCFGKEESRLNPWGCKQARMDWAEWAPWMSYGSFSKSLMGFGPYEWTFDKERIRHELETNLFRFRNCPNLNFEFVEAIVEFLPTTVKVEGSDDWTYSRSYDERPGAILVREVNKTNDYTWSSEYYADGIRPKGFRVFVEVLTKAAAKVRRTDITPQLLTD